MDYGGEEEDYIEMEVSSSSCSSNHNHNHHCCSSPQSREFEFQMCTTTSTTTPTATSPADHLFHKGKLLPLYLLPSAAAAATASITFKDMTYYSLPSTNTANTPLDSSPPDSRRVSCDLTTSDDYFFEWSKDLNTFIHHPHPHPHPTYPTKTSTWPKKLNLIKNSIIAHKLRASKAYLKSLFVFANNPKQPKPVAETAPYPTIAAIINNIERESSDCFTNNNNHSHVQRRSFSSAIKRHSPTKCLSSSSSSNSSSGSSSFSLNSNNGGLHDEGLRRSSSATEVEGSIEAAIAHCKNSRTHC